MAFPIPNVGIHEPLTDEKMVQGRCLCSFHHVFTHTHTPTHTLLHSSTHPSVVNRSLHPSYPEWLLTIAALTLLDEEISKNELLMSVAPLRLISVGGALAVRLCRNRDSTWDIDCLLDPNVAAADDYTEEFQAAVTNVASTHGFGQDWLNHEVEMFVERDKRMQLFLESVDQGIAVFEGANIVIYAGMLDWALERKVRRVAHSVERKLRKPVDLPDAAALVKLMRDNGAPPLTFEYVRGLNFNGFDIPPTDEAIQQVADYYVKTYGEIGITRKDWQAMASKIKEKDGGLGNRWVRV
jgi:hypothetical protein